MQVEALVDGRAVHLDHGGSISTRMAVASTAVSDLGLELRAALLDETDVGVVRLAEMVKPARKSGAWRALLADPDIGAAALAAVARSAALGGDLEPRARVIVEDLLSALGQLRHEPARATLVRCWSTAQPELRLRAGHALIRFGDRAALEVVAGALDDDGNRRQLALQAIFTLDPATAWDRLAAAWAAPSQHGGVRLGATLQALMHDLNDDGRAHWGPSRRWFEADPRWLELCRAWTALPAPAERERWGPGRAQEIVELAAWLRKRQGA
ncbi:MAG: HEAT repeat domain-containing protein [Myxococcales bacterium]|nr:HEAT repeat domain-containing protein [Myxococcales bacterium]